RELHERQQHVGHREQAVRASEALPNLMPFAAHPPGRARMQPGSPTAPKAHATSANRQVTASGTPDGRRWFWPRGTDSLRAYAGRMSIMRDELHHLIDRLPEEQVAPMLALVRDSLPAGDDEQELWPLPSFVGTLASGKGDIAARSQDILREEMGRDAR